VSGAPEPVDVPEVSGWPPRGPARLGHRLRGHPPAFGCLVPDSGGDEPGNCWTG